MPVQENPFAALAKSDSEVLAAIRREEGRQREGLELIASENYTSAAVMEAAGTVPHQQVRRRLSRPALLRRLRVRRRRRRRSPATG